MCIGFGVGVVEQNNRWAGVVEIGSQPGLLDAPVIAAAFGQSG